MLIDVVLGDVFDWTTAAAAAAATAGLSRRLSCITQACGGAWLMTVRELADVGAEEDEDEVELDGEVSLDNEEYILISSSCLGKDQKIIRRWTGSGICSYFNSIDWKGICSATILALRSRSECGAPV